MLTNKPHCTDNDDFTVNLTVPLEYHGWRLDQFLAHQFTDYSRGQWQQAIQSGEILLNQKPAKNKSNLSMGDYISGTLSVCEHTKNDAQNIALNVLHADESIIVIDKPAGLVVHPAAGNRDGTLLNALLFHFPELANLPRAGIVHRLDKETSGVMIVARTPKAHTHLVQQLQTRTMGRTYLALVYRYVTAGDSIDLPIGRHPKERVRMSVRKDGKPAITHYRIEERFSDITLLRVQLETGRTHQIRVHLSYLNYPLVGDSVYGHNPVLPKGLSDEIREALLTFPRQALHATELRLIHPQSNQPCQYHSPLPADMNTLLQHLRQHRTSTP